MSALAIAEKAPPQVRVIDVALPARFAFLADCHRYKVAYGGRYGLKSHSFARALLALGVAQELRVLGCREVLKSTKESQHVLLTDLISQMGMHAYYEVQEHGIYAKHNRTQFTYAGLADHTADTIKSFEGVDVAWVMEGQKVRKRSWDILIPTIRAKGSEIWVEFNPDMESDEVWQRFIVHPPDDAIVVKTGWQYARECGFWTKEAEADRLYDLKHQLPEDYENIWEGKCRQSVVGAIYGREVAEMAEEKRMGKMPYDPRLPVHTIWDLGWNDATAIIFVQKPAPSTVIVVNYLEDSFRRPDQWATELLSLGYFYGEHWLPHDGGNADIRSSGKSMQEILTPMLKKKPKVIERMSDKEVGIRAARMMLPRVYIDDAKRDRVTGYAGGWRLLDCLRKYRRNVPRGTNEPSTPVHDEFAHGADAFAQLALIVDQIRNESEALPMQILPAFHNPVPSMGLLG